MRRAVHCTCCALQARGACFQQKLGAFSSNITSQMAGAVADFAFDLAHRSSVTRRRRRKFLLPFLDSRLRTITQHYVTQQVSSAVTRLSGIYLRSGYAEIFVVLCRYYPHEYWTVRVMYFVSPDKFRDRTFIQTTTDSVLIFTLHPSRHSGRYRLQRLH